MAERYNITLRESTCWEVREQPSRPLERGSRPGATNPVVTENRSPANRPADPERGQSLREWLIDALALAMGGLAVYHYKPDSFLAGLMIFVGAYTLTNSLQGLNWHRSEEFPSSCSSYSPQ